MRYSALYRKFRPQSFGEVRGQDHITNTLKNEIKADRIGHAYLFTGTRGTGKTSVAKVFARAINCESPAEDGSPCGECDVCRAIADGSSMNVMEIDAASNNGVEDIRAIIEDVEYLPTSGRFKVYIIDEVHMLSTAAFNAFLKTLEEPPEHVVFILATTELHKIPITILSRCQQFDFRRISISTIVGRMEDIMASEGYRVQKKALEYIARKADGSMRDALSLLDRVISFYLTQLQNDEEITFDGVLEVLGTVETETFSTLLRAISSRDAITALGVIEQVIVQGREITQFLTDYVWYLRNLLLIKAAPDLGDTLDMSSEDIDTLKEEAQTVSEHTVMRYIGILSDLLYDLARSSQKRTIAEMGIIKMLSPQTERTDEALYQRIEMIEAQLANGVIPAPAPQQSAAEVPAAAAVNPSVKSGPQLPKALSDQVKKVAENWKTIADSAGGMMRALLMEALVSADDDGRLLLVYDAADGLQQTYYRQLSQPGKQQEIEKLIAAHVGAEVEVKLILNQDSRARERNYADIVTQFEERTGFKVEVEDF